MTLYIDFATYRIAPSPRPLLTKRVEQRGIGRELAEEIARNAVRDMEWAMSLKLNPPVPIEDIPIGSIVLWRDDLLYWNIECEVQAFANSIFANRRLQRLGNHNGLWEFRYLRVGESVQIQRLPTPDK